MTLNELKNRVIFQVNADEDDLDDYEPAITGYVNTAYDQILYALTKRHLNMGGVFVSLVGTEDAPLVPEWTHAAIADYATYLVYRNGNTQKQSRGQMYLQSYNEVYQQCRELYGKVDVNEETGEMTIRSMKPRNFYNVYNDMVYASESASKAEYDPF